MLLRVSNLNKQIGQKELFDSLSFILEEGTKTALIGRNGLGKSTLFKILNGEDKDFTGQIELKKNSILNSVPKILFRERNAILPLLCTGLTRL